MKFALVFALLVSAVVAAEFKEEFQQWVRLHNKQYKTPEEFQHRYAVFKSNAEYIRAFQKERHTYTLSLNRFADLTGEEFGKWYLSTVQETRNHDFIELPAPTADEVNWVTYGAVTGVKDQGQCGSCWSFSTTGALEGQNYLKSGALISLSEQQLVDCSVMNNGCDGGSMDSAFQYVVRNGVELESVYPYEAKQDTCRYDSSKVVVQNSGHKDIEQGSESQLTSALQSVGPISVAIDASHTSFQLYHSGVYYEPRCSSVSLDHGVLAVGYGHDDTSGQDYYIVKNSWGTGWGMDGYIWMSRNRNNNCGIATEASYPIM